MADLREIHAQSYNDMDFGDFARRYHQKFYSDMPFEQFAAKAGVETAIPQGDWSALKSRIDARVENERNIVGPVREQDLQEVAKAEAARQGRIYGRQYGKDESALGVAGGAAANMMGLSIPRLAEAYVGQYTLPGAQAHEFLKAADKGRAEARPGASLAGTGLGILGQVAMLPTSGAATIGGRALAAGGQAGAISGIDELAETRGDVGQSLLAAGVGAGTGAVGAYAMEKGIQAGRKLIDPLRGLAKSGPVDQQAVARVLLAAKNAGIDDATAQAKLAQLGPDGFLADILGKRGESLARSSANLSPDAREILEGASTARLGGQTDRLVQALSTAGKVQPGQTVPELVEGIKAAGRPSISAAYAQAQKSGSNMLGSIAPDGTVRMNALNNAALNELFHVPKVKAAIKQAMDETTARVAISGPDAASHWATLDRARQILANEGFKSGDDVAKGLAKRLNETLDLIIPEGSIARKVAQQNILQRNAVEYGAQAARQPASDFARQVAAQKLPQHQVRQGYAAQQIARLLSTKGGGQRPLDMLDGSANAREVLAKALLGRAGPVQRQIGAERQFVRFDRALQGNSTTARQLAELGMAGAAGAGGGYLTGFDPMQAGSIAGLAVLARRGGSKALEAFARKNEAAVAPHVARRLLDRGLPNLKDPSGKPISETARRKLIEALLRDATKGAAFGYGQAQ